MVKTLVSWPVAVVKFVPESNAKLFPLSSFLLEQAADYLVQVVSRFHSSILLTRQDFLEVPGLTMGPMFRQPLFALLQTLPRVARARIAVAQHQRRIPGLLDARP